MAALPYLQLYPADYLADTMHLTTEEHGAYLLIIFNYWQTGKPIKSAHLPAIAKLSNERWADVEQSLKDYFEISEDGFWIHHRIEFDLKAVKVKSTKASRAGKMSAAKRAARKALEIKENPTDVQHTHNTPLNHTDTEADIDIEKEKKKETKKKNPLAVRPDYVDEQVWDDFILQRKTKFTQTAFNGLCKQAEKAGISVQEALAEAGERGWQSFKAEWYTKGAVSSRPQRGGFSGKDYGQTGDRL